MSNRSDPDRIQVVTPEMNKVREMIKILLRTPLMYTAKVCSQKQLPFQPTKLLLLQRQHSNELQMHWRTSL